jgi:hypothetical protein
VQTGSRIPRPFRALASHPPGGPTNRPDQLRRSGIFVAARPPSIRLKLRRSDIATRCQHDVASLGLRTCILGSRGLQGYRSYGAFRKSPPTFHTRTLSDLTFELARTSVWVIMRVRRQLLRTVFTCWVGCLMFCTGCANLMPSASYYPPETGGLKVDDNTRGGIAVAGTLLYFLGPMLAH